jgi:hypothetical protein
MTDEAMKEHLLEQVADVHEHFVELMNGRLPELSQREIELYLGVLGKLVAKLEERTSRFGRRPRSSSRRSRPSS